MKKILIVDDDTAIQHALKLAFPSDLYMVDVHTNGTMILEGRFEKPDIFLLDKQLNGVDGLELCKVLKSNEETKLIPVIILSASPYIKGTAIAAGADAVIEKPFSLAHLRQLLTDFMK